MAGFSLKAIVCPANSENIPTDTQRQQGNWEFRFFSTLVRSPETHMNKYNMLQFNAKYFFRNKEA